ncbi:helix-turn-helix transcriptional regulator [Halomarina rubra]|uniref:Helix-turn-helix transcriptional regulator n=1 Tax=Halomarina rubra TaxID=2071873 RepID=A0ABD6ARJ6_9EURY|nr:helix-turn-helix transcriptional regulator [Halomarina rubra]
MRWLESGTRRDMCVALLALGEARGPELKRHLERHYDDRLDSKRFYDRLSALETSGHVERHVDGLDDVYSLTERGERGVRAQQQWLADCVETAEGDEE